MPRKRDTIYDTFDDEKRIDMKLEDGANQLPAARERPAVGLKR